MAMWEWAATGLAASTVLDVCQLALALERLGYTVARTFVSGPVAYVVVR